MKKNECRIDFSKLLGFDMVGDRLSAGVDFKDDAIGARLGAKVGKPFRGEAETKIKSHSTNK